ncbi:MAG: excinuclease ABC subunit UvrA [Bacteroidales bacterium]|nr:excinuclease ABC subunit UvrA [Bacteroidales bacterium]
MLKQSIESFDPKENIIIKGARVHNLKNIDIVIPKNKLVVITGLSGSGKSSLAFDTLYADGQRRYVESLSSYARQFLGRMSNPDVDYIKGIAPAIAIEQKVNTRNPRSTVGTSTEIYDYLKLLYARIGRTNSPVSGKLVKRHSVSDVVDYVMSFEEGAEIMILTEIGKRNKEDITEKLPLLLKQGFSRIFVNEQIVRISDALGGSIVTNGKIKLVIDRILLYKDNKDIPGRIADSVETAFYEGKGSCLIKSGIGENSKEENFSSKFEADGIIFEEPTVNLFSFNNPYGACKKCEGFGSVIGIDEDLVIPNKSLSVYDDAIVCWKGEKMSEWKDQLVMKAYKFDFPIHKPMYDLTNEQKELLWNGNKYFDGLDDFFSYVESKSYKIQYRVMLSRYRGKTVCPECKGTRLRKDAGYVKIEGKSINQLVLFQVSDLLSHINSLKLTDYENKVGGRLLQEISGRLEYLQALGLGYLTMNRLSNTSSGGESQRINLATSIGSSLVGSLYILDEPSIGLHPRDTKRLINVLEKLRDNGNTVIVVEHDEEIIRKADAVIDIGPMAGVNGGDLIYNGDLHGLLRNKESLTAQYLNGEKSIKLPLKRRSWKEYIEISGARENNLKNVDARIPLNAFTVVTGVSGSGKTSLVKNILYASLKRLYGGYTDRSGKFDRINGSKERISGVEFVDQNPIGRSSRSNAATYVKAYDDIRHLFASQQISKIRGYKPGFFSFNIEGGRCEECEGEGVVKIEMQFMADLHLKCDVCNGKRFKEELLDVKYKEKNISDILELTINQAIEFFSSSKQTNTEKKIIEKLKPLQEVGLGYLGLGQSSSTLSGGEALRVKLAYFLSKSTIEKPLLFIFDEPTTGLHYHDISKLLKAFDALIEKGHSIVVIEHNMEVIKCGDWISDMGPEGGEQGGEIVFEGTPEGLVNVRNSHTAYYIKEKL